MGLEKSFEYNKSPNKLLDLYQQGYFMIPKEIIEDFQMGDQRVAVLAYISMRRGIDYQIRLSTNDIVIALEKAPDNRPGRINSKVDEALAGLMGYGCIKRLSNSNNQNSVQTFLYDLKQMNKSKERFAIVYSDEAGLIFDSKYSNKEILFLVFAYLRLRISVRKNVEVFDKNEYRNSLPEVYDGYYSDIAKAIGVSVYAVQKAVNALVELGLIYIEEQPRQLVRSSNGRERWMTGRTFFCNTYKREEEYQYISGKQYYEKEIASKHYKLKNLKGGEAK